MNQKIVFCIAFLVILCCDAGVSSAAVENNVGDFDDINKTLTIYDNECKVMTVRLISAVPDLCTFTEIFEVSNYEAYIPDKDNDFRARTVSYAGSGVTDVEWFIEQNISYTENVTDYDVIQVEEIVHNNKTGKNETILINKTVITRYHDETRYKITWIDYQPYVKEMKKDHVLKIKVVYHKRPELGPFHIQTIPMFRGIECPELTWWSGSWDRRRAIHIDNTVGDAVIDYQLKSVNLSSYSINASSSRIVKESSGLEESFFSESVDANGNLEFVWCNFSSVPNGDWINTTYYVYYQSSPSVGSVSDGDATFISFDDFSGILTDNWNVHGTAAIVNEELKIIANSVWNVDGVVLKTQILRPYIIEVDLKLNTVNPATIIGPGASTLNIYDGCYVYFRSSSEIHALVDNVRTYTGDSFSTNVWKRVGVQMEPPNSYSYFYNYVNIYSASDYPSDSEYIQMQVKETNAIGYFDNFRVRKYTANEPEPWTVGAEEEYVAPTPTPTPAPTTSVSPAQYDELDLPLILYILTISMLYLLIAFRRGVAAVELSLVYLIFAFFFLLFQTITISVNYIYLTLFLLLFLISIAGITKQGAD